MTYLTRMTALDAKATAGPLAVDTSVSTLGPAIVRVCIENHDHATEPCIIVHVGALYRPDTTKTIHHENNSIALNTTEFLVALRNSWPKLRRLIEACQIGRGEGCICDDGLCDECKLITDALADLDAE